MNAPRQRGASLLVVLVLLTVLLLGSLTMARSDMLGTLIAGNVAARNAAVEASEVGLSDAYAQLIGLTSEDTDQPAIGYFATRRADVAGAPGIPDVDWTSQPSTTVGSYTVSRVIERLCATGATLPITETARYCMLGTQSAQGGSTKVGAVALGGSTGKQYRVTVNVSGPNATQVFVQDLVVR